MKQCPRCGNWLNDFDTYCGRCGFVYQNYNRVYNQAMPIMPVVQQTNSFAVASLVLGIISVLGLCFYLIPSFLGILAIVFGIKGRSSINQSNGTQKGTGMAIAGLIMGIVSVAFALLFLLLIFVGVMSNIYSNGVFTGGGHQYNG